MSGSEAIVGAAARVTFVDGVTTNVREGVGGGALARCVDEVGTGALLAVLGDHARVVLEDGDLRIELVRRDDGHVDVVTRWGGVESVERVVGGTKFAGAEGGQRPPSATPPPAVAAPRAAVGDLVEALHDTGRALVQHAASWYDAREGGDASIPALPPEALGSAAFRRAWGVRYALFAGSMAGGIASVDLVAAMQEAGFLASFGAGGLGLETVEAALVDLRARLGAPVRVANLLHNPVEPDVEEATVDLYVRHEVGAIEASAFMGLTPALVRWRLGGLREVEGRVVATRKVIAKVSRPEVAEHFLRPAAPRLVEELVAAGKLTPAQAALGARVAMADAITVEADSGGHTDRRPLPVVLPVMRRLRDRLAAETGLPPVHLGAGGGLGDPWALAAAFTLGADYVVTGSVNQCTREAGTSSLVKQMLAEVGYADVTQAPAPDMFELGAEVQVLARGSLYPQRARRLRELYTTYGSLEEIPLAERDKLEKQVFGRTLGEVWTETEAFWTARDRREVERARRDPRHRMALTFRWYLGMSSRWARQGEAARKRDFQVWCGPAMGAFNDWVRGSALAPAEARGVVDVNRALLRGAAVALRVQAAELAASELATGARAIAPG